MGLVVEMTVTTLYIGVSGSLRITWGWLRVFVGSEESWRGVASVGSVETWWILIERLRFSGGWTAPSRGLQ